MVFIIIILINIFNLFINTLINNIFINLVSIMFFLHIYSFTKVEHNFSIIFNLYLQLIIYQANLHFNYSNCLLNLNFQVVSILIIKVNAIFLIHKHFLNH